MKNEHGKTAVRQYFESGDARWERRYQGDSVEACAYFDRESAALELARRYLSSGAEVLEFGCGTGQLSQALEGGGYAMTSCDLAFRMAQQTRDNTQRGQTLVADIEKPPFRNASFDAVVLIGVISYINQPLRVLTNLRHLLRPGGILIVSSANRKLLMNAVSRRIGGQSATNNTPGRPAKESANETAGRRAEFFRETCTYYKASEFNKLVPQAGYQLLTSRNIGFGRLRLPGVRNLSDKRQIAMSRALSVISRHWPCRPLGDFAFANVACFRSNP